MWGEKKSQIKESKTGFVSSYGKQTFLWVSWYFCWNILVFSLNNKNEVSLLHSPQSDLLLFSVNQRKHFSFPELNRSLHGPLYNQVFIHMHILLPVSVLMALCSTKKMKCCRVTKLETQNISACSVVKPCWEWWLQNRGKYGRRKSWHFWGSNLTGLDYLVSLKLLLQAEMQRCQVGH